MSHPFYIPAKSHKRITSADFCHSKKAGNIPAFLIPPFRKDYLLAIHSFRACGVVLNSPSLFG